MPDPKSSILRHQNDPSMLALLRAMSASHARAQRLDSLCMYLSVLVAVSGLVAAFTTTTAATTSISLTGAVWASAYSAGFDSWAKRELRRAALLQEMFDVRLFRIQWNLVLAGEELGAQEVNWLDKRYRAREDTLRNYYEIPDLPRPYDVLACQQQNLGWGARVRRRYAHTVLVIMFGWSVLGLAVGIIAGLTVVQLMLRWYVPSLGMFLLGLDTFRGQRDVAAERERLLTVLCARVSFASAAEQRDSTGLTEELMLFARQVQDILFLSRLRVSRVPDWFFLRFHSSDRNDFQAAMNELVATLNGRHAHQ
jgi:hypothetical protein